MTINRKDLKNALQTSGLCLYHSDFSMHDVGICHYDARHRVSTEDAS